MRTAEGTPHRSRYIPWLPAPSAVNPRVMGADNLSAADLDGSAKDKRLRDLLARTLEYPAEGRTGDIHFCRSFFLRITQKICKAQRLEFIGSEKDDVELAERDPCGLECQCARTARDVALFDWSGHGIMSICS